MLEPAGGIAGTVTDAATGKPVAGARVGAQLLEHRLRILGGYGDTVTDDRGHFLVGGLEPGVYNLLFTAPPGRERVTARAVEGLRVRPGADTSADLVAIESRPLHGVVVDRESGQPVVGAQVGCYGPARPHTGPAVMGKKTDDQGRFTFQVPPGEQYVYLMDGSQTGRLSRRTVVVPEQGEIEPLRLLRASQGGLMPMPQEVIFQKAALPAQPPARAIMKEALKIEAKAVTKDLNRARPPAEAKVEEPAPIARSVTGRVRGPDGRPLVGVSVYVTPIGPGAERFDSAATDREGTFVLAGIPRRPIRINLSLAGYQGQTESLPEDRDQVEFTFRLEPDQRAIGQPGPSFDEPIPPGLRDRLTFVDLARHGNDFLSEGPGYLGNDLNRLPIGLHRLGETYFRIGEKMIHLRGGIHPDLAQAVKGIEVKARGRVLHFLHATEGRSAPGTLIGAYVAHYADGTSERIPIVYGRSLVDWLTFPRSTEEPTEAKVAWTGSTDSTDRNPGFKVRLFDMTWTNPHPEKEIAAIDVISAAKECDPFLVALTLERD
jgi:hypothetical protein